MTMTRTAPAKINLTLEILGRRNDGYHNIRSVMQAISLHDVLNFQTAPPGVLTLVGGSPEAPPTDDNLVLKAARAIMAETEGRHGARISLRKQIPVGAGLGGGSSDAATTLQALNDLWKARIPPSRLSAIAATIGSDVPFFLTEGTALAEGRGEVLTPIPPSPPICLVVVKPVASLSTPAVYRAHMEMAFGHGPCDKSRQMIEALHQRASGFTGLSHIVGALCNDLEDAARHLCPEVGRLMSRLHDAGAAGVLLSGSGSAVFALANTMAQAHQMAGVIAPNEAWTTVAHTVSLPWKGTD